MARRGDELREHILWKAKDVFLEMGFEGSSMDEVARRAETSKRSLYAHFESKEKLFLAVIAFVRGLFLGRLRTPADYSTKPAEAVTRFCGRYLEILLYQGSIRMCRVLMAAAERFPDGAAQHYDVFFTEVQTRLSAYLKTAYRLSASASTETAQRLLGQLMHPRFSRALFGIDPVARNFDPDGLSPDFDLKPVRRAVAALLPPPEKPSQ